VPRTGSGISLVGRQNELAGLRSALATAAKGQARTVLLSGDAGIGKSRLLAELVTYAESAGVTVLTGRCLDVDEAGLPYLPFVEALGQLTPAQRAVANSRPMLNRLVAGLSDAVPTWDDNPAMEQLRLFDSVLGLVTDLAADRPLLLAVEDLHWADASTRDLVLFLVSRLHTQRVLVVGTWRADDLHRRHPLRPLLTQLTRLSTVDSMRLPPFTRTDTVEFVSALTDGTLPMATVGKIADRSEGNPFFCEELTAVYGDGAGVPSGLAELLLSRVERLSPAARRVVRAVAVASSKVKHTSLAAVCELDEDVLEEALREAVQLNVLVAVDTCYTFRHALLREAVYADLLPGERVRLHAGYADVVERPASVAHHSVRSHDLPRALAASVEAAHHAAKVYASGEKLRMVEQALELWSAVPNPEEVSGTTEVVLLRMAATSAGAIGETDRAIEFARTAVARADELADPELAATTRHELIVAMFALEDKSVGFEAIIDRAWELVRDRPPSLARARILSLKARSWIWTVDVTLDIDELRAYAEEAIDNAKQVGAASVEVDGLVTLAVFAEWTGHPEKSIEVGRLAAERAKSIGAFQVELRALKNMAITLAVQGRTDEAVTLSEYICRRAADVGLPWGLTSVDAHFGLVFLHFYTGDWAKALATANVAGVPSGVWARINVPTLHVLAAQGEFDRLDEVAAELDRLSDDAFNQAIANHARAEAAVWSGQPHKAVEHVLTSFDQMATLGRTAAIDVFVGAQVGVRALADIAEAARARGDSAATEEAVAAGKALVDRLVAFQPRTWVGQMVYEDSFPRTVVLHTQITAETQRLLGEDASEHWRGALEATDGFPYYQAYSRWRLAAALLAEGARDQAAEALLAAHSTAVQLGAVPLRNALAALARRARIPLPGVVDDTPDSGLTPRELAVLELVAAGMTNREVGARLYISQKTASVHLSRAMAKLGAANRTEVVSIAHERGLLSAGRG
jgi:DNA-binding CsgD family transcriptional regulator/tetratricopeptide (TPR) repeat protein